MTSSGSSSVFAGFRFPPEVISIAVRWNLRYGPSYRDVEELLAERGVTVDHVTIYGGCSGTRPAAVSCPSRHGLVWLLLADLAKRTTTVGPWARLRRVIPAKAGTSLSRNQSMANSGSQSLAIRRGRSEADVVGQASLTRIRD